MTILRIAAALVLVLAVAACGGGASPTAEPTPTATPEPTEEPSVDASVDAGALPSLDLPSSDAELEALLPDQVGDVQLEKLSMRGNEFMTSGDDNQEFVEFLTRVGAEPDDVSVAFAFGMSDDFESGASIFAFRVAGVSSDRLVPELQASIEEEGTASNFEARSIAGKNVLAGDPADETTGTAYLYGVGDIVFFIGAPDDAAAEEVLNQLP